MHEERLMAYPSASADAGVVLSGPNFFYQIVRGVPGKVSDPEYDPDAHTNFMPAVDPTILLPGTPVIYVQTHPKGTEERVEGNTRFTSSFDQPPSDQDKLGSRARGYQYCDCDPRQSCLLL